MDSPKGWRIGHAGEQIGKGRGLDDEDTATEGELRRFTRSPIARSPDRSPVPALAPAGLSLVVGPRAVALRAAVLAGADRAFR